MIPVVFSSPVPIANAQARQSAAQTQAQSQNTQSTQTASSSNSSQNQSAQKPGSKSTVCSAPSCTTFAEMTGTVTSAASNPPLSIQVKSTLSSHLSFERSTTSFVSHYTQHQSLLRPQCIHRQFQMYLDMSPSQSPGTHSQPSPNLCPYTTEA
jgi:DNA mismatch repair ATPase MutL